MVDKRRSLTLVSLVYGEATVMCVLTSYAENTPSINSVPLCLTVYGHMTESEGCFIQ